LRDHADSGARRTLHGGRRRLAVFRLRLEVGRESFEIHRELDEFVSGLRCDSGYTKMARRQQRDARMKGERKRYRNGCAAWARPRR